MPAGAVLEARGLYHIYRGPEVETVALRGAELALREGSWSSVMGPSGSGKSTLRPRPRRSGRAERRVGGGRRRRPHPPRPRSGRAGASATWASSSSATTCIPRSTWPTTLPSRCGWPAGRPARSGPGSSSCSGPSGWATGAGTGSGSCRAARPSGPPSPSRSLPGRVLLADEPTGELDEATADGVLDLLAELHRRRGATILTVTHNPQVAERADRRLTMRDGRVLDDA